jgi:hypothetical protein
MVDRLLKLAASHASVDMHHSWRFRITRAQDFTLQWEPPAESRALADALSYHYPFPKTLLEKMQQATDDFFKQESCMEAHHSAYDVNAPTLDGQALGLPVEVHTASFPTMNHNITPAPERPANLRKRGAAELETSSTLAVNSIWDVNTGMPAKTRGRKGPLNPAKRRQTANNRGNICAGHKKLKTTVSIGHLYIASLTGIQCDPDSCPQNKLYLQRLNDASHESSTTPVNKTAREQSIEPQRQGYHHLRLQIPSQEISRSHQSQGLYSPKPKTAVQSRQPSERPTRDTGIDGNFLQVPSIIYSPAVHHPNWSSNTAKSPTDMFMSGVAQILGTLGDGPAAKDGDHQSQAHGSPNGLHMPDVAAAFDDWVGWDESSLNAYYIVSSRQHSPLLPSSPLFLSPQPSLVHLSPQPSLAHESSNSLPAIYLDAAEIETTQSRCDESPADVFPKWPISPNTNTDTSLASDISELSELAISTKEIYTKMRLRSHSPLPIQFKDFIAFLTGGQNKDFPLNPDADSPTAQLAKVFEKASLSKPVSKILRVLSLMGLGEIVSMLKGCGIDSAHRALYDTTHQLRIDDAALESVIMDLVAKGFLSEGLGKQKAFNRLVFAYIGWLSQCHPLSFPPFSFLPCSRGVEFGRFMAGVTFTDIVDMQASQMRPNCCLPRLPHRK